MDGLLVYRQYLENIRGSIKNLKLPELESKEFMGIIGRVNQIEDLSYIDVILKNAGLNLSFIGDRSFLDKKVVLKSKLDVYFEDSVDMNSAMKSALSEYMSMFISEEDEIIKDIEEFSGENGIPEVSLDYFPKSSARYYSAKEIIEHNKETLSALFGALEEMDKKLEKSEEIDKKRAEEMGIVEEYFDEETSDRELVLEDKDIQELISEEIAEEKSSKIHTKTEDDLEVFEKSTFNPEKLRKPLYTKLEKEPIVEVEEVEEEDIQDIDVEPDIEDIEEVEEEKEIKSDSFIDTSFLLDDDPDDSEIESSTELADEEDDFDSEIESDEDISEDFDNYRNQDYDIDNKSFGREPYYDEEQDDEYEDDYNSNLNQKDFNSFFDENDREDTTGYELEEDLRDEDDRLLRDTDPREQNAFEEATNYFLTGKSQSYSDDSLKKLYKSKEKIVKAEGVNDTDDGLAKMVLALSDGLMNLPHLTGGLFRKAKKNGKKMRETMIVEDDEDEEF